jgi:hypothetical protein
VHDDFRVTSRLRLGFGLRFEREGGTSERFNRGLIGMYDFSFVPPYAQATQNDYATWLADPTNANGPAGQYLAAFAPAAKFNVAGGVSYLGQQYPNYTAGANRFLPNASMVYSSNGKTVLRIGGGLFGDTFNANTSSSSLPFQNGYNHGQSHIRGLRQTDGDLQSAALHPIELPHRFLDLGKGLPLRAAFRCFAAKNRRRPNLSILKR